MVHKEKRELFDGWATAHIVEAHSSIMPTIVEAYPSLGLAISKRPAEQIEVRSPTGRSVGNNYFQAHPFLSFSPNEIARIVCKLWLHAAIIRYCELWGAFTTEKFVRSYRGTVRLRVWIEHVLQDDAKREDRISLKYRPQDNKWTLTDPQSTYPHIRRWPSQAIASARKFAWKYNKRSNIL